MELLKYQDFILRSQFKENILLNNNIRLSQEDLLSYKTINWNNLIDIQISTDVRDYESLTGYIKYGRDPLVYLHNVSGGGNGEYVGESGYFVTSYFPDKTITHSDTGRLGDINNVQDVLNIISDNLHTNIEQIKQNGISNEVSNLKMNYIFSSLDGFENYPYFYFPNVPESEYNIMSFALENLNENSEGIVYVQVIGEERILFELISPYTVHYQEKGEEVTRVLDKQSCEEFIQNSLGHNYMNMLNITGTLANCIRIYYNGEDSDPRDPLPVAN